MTPGLPAFEVPAALVIVAWVVVPADAVVVFATVVEVAAPPGMVVVFEMVVEIAALLKVVDVTIPATDGPVVVGIEECAVVVTKEPFSGPLEMTAKAIAPPTKISTMTKTTKGDRGPNLLNCSHRRF